MFVKPHRFALGLAAASGLLFCLSSSVFAVETNTFTQISYPPGFVNVVSYPQTTSSVTTVSAPWVTAGYRFTHWTLGSTEASGVRVEDAYGKGVNPVAFTIYEDTVAVAHYLDDVLDLDGDRVPDWYEIHFLASTNYPAVADPDGDGLSLLEEYRRDLHPNLRESVVDGGRSRRRSPLVTMILEPDHYLYTEISSPAGFVSRSMVVSNGTAMVTPSLHGAVTGFEFGYWTIDGVRQADHTGRAVDVVTTVVTSTVEAVAHYFKSTDDTDVDGIPDWWEWHSLGQLDLGAADDPDGDGLSMLEEYRRDLHPGAPESVADGGVSRRRSPLSTFDISDLVAYTMASIPAGFVSSAGYVTNEQVVATPSLHGAISGFSFAYWSVNGLRAEDERGVALDKVVLPLLTNTAFVAHYFKTTDDLDGDGMQDWWEWMYLGGTNSGSWVDHDGDGLSALEEFRRDTDPRLYNTVRDGGVSRRRSALTLMNMQFFERLAYAQVDGIVSNVFTIWPDMVTGFDFGTNSVPTLGDWDGDGDRDLFVAAGGGLLSVFENIGSDHVLNLSERTVAFGGLVSDLANPLIACGDWNGDGFADLAVGAGGSIRLRSSPGDFVFSPGSVSDVVVSSVTNAVPAMGDLDGDGRVDLAVLCELGQVQIFLNTGNPVAPFSSIPSLTTALPESVPQAVSVAIADVDRDGDRDLLVTDLDGRTWEFRAQADGSFPLYSKMWAGTGYGFANRLTLAIADLDGDADVDAMGGFAGGGLMLLRDPRLGPPANLRALAGPISVQLRWNPDPQARVSGYYIYRSTTAVGPFECLTTSPILLPEYLDADPSPSVTNYYRVTGLTMAHYPGSTVARMIEGPPSDIVSAEAGSVRLTLLDYQGQAGSNAVLRLSVDNAAGIAADGMNIEVTYDPTVLTPREQVLAEPTVERTGLSRDMVFTDNGATASGTIVIQGVSGGSSGEGHLFEINFIVDAQASNGITTSNTFGMVTIYGTQGQLLPVDASSIAVLTVSSAYFLGDIDGNGTLNQDDFTHFMWLLRGNTRTPTSQEIAAGDMNGDGVLSHADIPLFRKLLAGSRRNP